MSGYGPWPEEVLALPAGEWVKDGKLGKRRFVPAPDVAPDWAESHRPQAVCGTDGGYHHHKRNREAFCDPCRDAHAEAKARYRQQKDVA